MTHPTRRKFLELSLGVLALEPANLLPAPAALAEAAVVDSIAALRSLPAPAAGAPQSVNVAGYRAPGDGGGGTFTWQAGSTQADDGGMVIAPAGAPSGRWLRSRNGFVDVRWFGAHGDNAADDTGPVQAAASYAAAAACELLLSAGTYKLGHVLLKNGVRRFYGSGVLVCNAASGDGVLVLDGPRYGGAPVQNCVIEIARIDAGSIVKRGIFAAQAMGCTFSSITIVNIPDVVNAEGIRLFNKSANNTVRGMKIFLPRAPKNSMPCIGLAGNGGAGNFYGAPSDPPEPSEPVSDNLVTDNDCDGGSHGVELNAGCRNTIRNNRCTNQRDRGIILAASSKSNTVDGNLCSNFGSSGVHICYGSSNNTVTRNTCSSHRANGESGIQSYVGASNNIIKGNTIDCTSRYGVYVAINSNGVQVLDNRISAYSRAGIAVESDWSASPPAGAAYSRPNYGPPADGRDHYADVDIDRCTISGNIIGDPSGPGPACGIYLGQVGNRTGLRNIDISDNRIDSKVLAHNLMFFEQAPGKLQSIHLTNTHVADPAPAKFSLARDGAHLAELSGNDGIGGR